MIKKYKEVFFTSIFKGFFKQMKIKKKKKKLKKKSNHNSVMYKKNMAATMSQ